MISALSLKYVLSENTRRAMNDLPPIIPCIISTVVRSGKVTASNEMEAMSVAMRVRQELYNAYSRVHGLFSRPCINVAVFKEAGDVEKNTWRVIAREMKRIG